MPPFCSNGTIVKNQHVCPGTKAGLCTRKTTELANTSFRHSQFPQPRRYSINIDERRKGTR